jgi:hypothetical protein
MANDVFSIASDIEVSIYTYASNTMVWSVSRWDEDNWASGSETFSWQNVSADVVSVNTSNGFEVQRGYTRPLASTASIVMQSTTYDPAMNSLIRPGTPVRVRVRPNPDTAPSTWVVLWQGKVSDCKVAYSKQWNNTIILECENNLRDVVNYVAQSGITVANPCYSTDFWSVISTDTGVTISQSGGPGLIGYQLEGYTTTAPVDYGVLVNHLSDSNLGALVYQPKLDPEALYYYTWYELQNRDLAPDVVFQGEVTTDANRAEFSDITVGFNTDQFVNTLHYTTAGGVDDYAQSDDSVAIAGLLWGEVFTRHYYATDADAAAAIATATIPTQLVEQISAPVLYRSGQVNEYLLRDPLDIAQVLVSNDKVELNEVFYISGVSHEISVDGWNATFDLWKGR